MCIVITQEWGVSRSACYEQRDLPECKPKMSACVSWSCPMRLASLLVPRLEGRGTYTGHPRGCMGGHGLEAACNSHPHSPITHLIPHWAKSAAAKPTGCFRPETILQLRPRSRGAASAGKPFWKIKYEWGKTFLCIFRGRFPMVSPEICSQPAREEVLFCFVFFFT